MRIMDKLESALRNATPTVISEFWKRLTRQFASALSILGTLDYRWRPSFSLYIETIQNSGNIALSNTQYFLPRQSLPNTIDFG